MSHLVVFLLAVLAAGLQAGAMPQVQPHPLGAPLLPVALIAGWAAIRGPDALWSVLVVTPLAVGPLAAERTGWYLMALLPAITLGTVLARPWDVQRPAGLAVRLGIAALVASCGTVLHAAILSLAGGDPAALFRASNAVLTSASWTLACALLLAGALWPLRPRTRGLFA